MDRYPEESELKEIAEWDYHDFAGLMKYVEDLWKYDGEYFQVIPGKKTLYKISTGGWSGNEDIIGALMNNAMFWAMCWKSSEYGGHYQFEVKQLDEETETTEDIPGS